MAALKSVLNRVYSVLITAQVIGMFALDFLTMYPSSLWQPSDAPLHFLVQFRQLYHGVTGDPYVVLPSAYHWFDALAHLELAAQLPLGAYFVYKVFSKSGVDGPAELAGLTFACLNTMGSYLAAYEIWHMSPEVVPAEKQSMLLSSEFGPYAVMSAVFAIDMYMRVLRRLPGPGKAKSQ